MAKQEIRTVNGKRYLYYTHYEKGGRTVTYCGPADGADSQIMGAKLELAQITSSIKALQERQAALKASISRLRAAKPKGSRTAKRKAQAGGDANKDAGDAVATPTKAAGRARKK